MNEKGKPTMKRGSDVKKHLESLQPVPFPVLIATLVGWGIIGYITISAIVA